MPNATLYSPNLQIAAGLLDDVEHIRKMNDNRLRYFTTPADKLDKDGIARGLGLSTTDNAGLERIYTLRDALGALEDGAIAVLKDELKQIPTFHAYQKAQRGVGEKTLGRLLSAIRDPYINLNTGEPRTVSQLWAYCGLHTLPSDVPIDAADVQVDPSQSEGAPRMAAKRKKGQQANWSSEAKMRAYLVIESCMKQLDKDCKSETGIADHVEGCKCSRYRIIVDERRKHTAVTHPDWTPGHSLNDGIRKAMKELLKDLWLEAKAYHEAT